MTITIPEGYYEASFSMTSSVGSPPLVTTIGCQPEDPTAVPNSLANRGFSAFSAAFADLIANEATLTKCTMQWQVGGVFTSIDSSQPPEAFTGDFNYFDVRAAVVLQKRTLRPGRAGRGRMFMPLSAQLDHVSVGGVVDDALRSDWDSAVIDFFELLTAAETTLSQPWFPVLLHSDPSMDPDVLITLSASATTGMIRGRR